MPEILVLLARGLLVVAMLPVAFVALMLIHEALKSKKVIAFLILSSLLIVAWDSAFETGAQHLIFKSSFEKHWADEPLLCRFASLKAAIHSSSAKDNATNEACETENLIAIKAAIQKADIGLPRWIGIPKWKLEPALEEEFKDFEHKVEVRAESLMKAGDKQEGDGHGR